MGKYEKLLIKIISGSSDKNIDFETFRNLLLKLGFEERNKRRTSHLKLFAKKFFYGRFYRFLTFNFERLVVFLNLKEVQPTIGQLY